MKKKPNGEYILPEMTHKARIARRFIILVVALAVLALVLLAFFAVAAGMELWEDAEGRHDLHFFQTIYTALIFSDIAVVLLAQQFMPSFHAVFRNSGFVMGTLLMRLSFSAEHPLDIAVSLFATLYVLALTYAVNRFPPSLLHNVSEDGDDKPEP